ncbi:MAG: right-handed parallel beta-helix repeat-containing protein [Omnitrophica WOR_2 bacterium]
MKNKQQYIVLPLILGMGLTLALIGLLNSNTFNAQASPGIRYVAPDGNDGTQCETIANRCRTVQHAVDAASPFDEIRVAMGTYKGTAGTMIHIEKTVILSGGWNSRFSARSPGGYPTILDAQRNGRVIFISGYISPTIDGFIITGGNASIETFAQQGGGIFSSSASPTIQNNYIKGNTAASGGGLYITLGAPVVRKNIISDNSADYEGGGFELYYSKATIESNLIAGNTAIRGGGGLYIDRSAPFTLTNNIIAQNQADGPGGGGIKVWGWSAGPASGKLVHNTIASNDLGSSAEGVFALGTVTLTLTNNLIDGHTYGILASNEAVVHADHTLFYNNSSGDIGGAGSTSNTSAITGKDPLFVNPATVDYHLQVESPARDAGASIPWLAADIDGEPRPSGAGYDIGADEVWRKLLLPLILR